MSSHPDQAAAYFTTALLTLQRIAATIGQFASMTNLADSQPPWQLLIR